jgi:hypothetical protein
MNTYTPFTTPSGREVRIRPRNYAEWENQEIARIQAVEAVPALAADGGNIQAVELALQRANLAVRNARLAAWVENFDKTKATLTLRDIAAIEAECAALEAVEIPLGNSVAGGSVH